MRSDVTIRMFRRHCAASKWMSSGAGRPEPLRRSAPVAIQTYRKRERNMWDPVESVPGVMRNHKKYPHCAKSYRRPAGNHAETLQKPGIHW